VAIAAMKSLLPQRARPYLADNFPPDISAVWFGNPAEALDAIRGAEVGWLDLFDPRDVAATVAASDRLRWVSTSFAGIGLFPLDLMRERGMLFTNGAGVNSIPVAELAVLGMLAVAKNLRAIFQAQERREWLQHAPGVLELFESTALIVGFGHIGREIAQRLRGFGVQVMGVRRHAGSEPDVLGRDQWRARLGEFDWIVLAAPETPETHHCIGRAELQRMKPTAWIVNSARGGLIDQPALIEAVRRAQIGGAFLDVTDPEPAPPEDAIWTVPNIIVSAHMGGRAQTRMTERGAALFLDNLGRYRRGQALANLVDLKIGY
jgi:phosphoglycerate dehydrogenase-like enzyme